MDHQQLKKWQHDHLFGQDQVRPGEPRTIIVLVLTATMMVVEIAAGLLYGSMALLADGLHMGSHAAALAITAFAYVYARRYAADRRFSFGTGKVNALGGFTSAILLGLFAATMAVKSIDRLMHPVEIRFEQAIAVAIVGLIVNAVSVLILGHHSEAEGEAHAMAEEHDHNLRAAYFHVLADALTSVLAIAALLCGRLLGWIWMDPLMGIVGAVLVGRWAFGLLHTTSGVLLDRQAPKSLREAIRDRVESQGNGRVADLHVWSIGPKIYAVELWVVTDRPRSPEFYKRLLPADCGLEHVTVEVHWTQEDEAENASPAQATPEGVRPAARPAGPDDRH